MLTPLQNALIQMMLNAPPTYLNINCISVCERSGTSVITVMLLSVEGRILEENIQTCLFNIKTEPHVEWVVHIIKGPWNLY